VQTKFHTVGTQITVWNPIPKRICTMVQHKPSHEPGGWVDFFKPPHRPGAGTHRPGAGIDGTQALSLGQWRTGPVWLSWQGCQPRRGRSCCAQDCAVHATSCRLACWWQGNGMLRETGPATNGMNGRVPVVVQKAAARTAAAAGRMTGLPRRRILRCLAQMAQAHVSLRQRLWTSGWRRAAGDAAPSGGSARRIRYVCRGTQN
jgi:hypothetical protein